MKIIKRTTQIVLRRLTLWGALGALVGALLGEGVLPLLRLPTLPRHPRPVDVVFVVDGTASMRAQIAGVQQGMIDFVTGLAHRGLDDVRIAAIVFRDNLAGEPATVLAVDGQPFSTDGSRLAEAIAEVRASGGGATPEESSLDALALAARQPFRPQARRIIVLVTDAPPLVPDQEMPSVAATVAFLRHRIDELHLILAPAARPAFTELRAAFPGQSIPLAAVAAGRAGFSLLVLIGGQVAFAGPCLLDPRLWPWRLDSLLLVVSLWAAIVGVLMAVILILGQAILTHQRPDLREAAVALGASAGAGLLAGTLSQLIFALLGSTTGLATPARIVGWALLGAGLGLGLGWAFPELTIRRGLLGGGSGGALAGLTFALLARLIHPSLSSALSGWRTGLHLPLDTGLRLVAALMLGGTIGWMVWLWVQIRNRGGFAPPERKPYTDGPYTLTS